MELSYVGSPDKSVRWINAVSEPVRALSNRPDLRSAAMNLEPEPFKSFDHGCPNLSQMSLAVVKNDHVIHVANIMLAVKFLLQVVVKSIQIDIGKELTCEIAYR